MSILNTVTRPGARRAATHALGVRGPSVRTFTEPVPDAGSCTPSQVSTESSTEVLFRAIGTSCRILVTDPDTLQPATEVALHHLAELDAAASRFRSDSEVSRLAAKTSVTGPGGIVTGFASVVLGDYLRAALEMAELTDGIVDPTVGSAVVAAGYDADISELRAHPDQPRGGDAAGVPGWQQVRVDEANLISLPEGTLLDLGATAKAHAADTIARRLAARFPGGFLVNLGGDIAISGEIPEAGWNIGIELADGSEAQVIRSDGAAVCTSSTQIRTWHSTTPDGDQVRHHIVDPRTGLSAPVVWATVTCVAPSAIVANAMSTAAIVLGHDAPDFLRRKGVTARLDAVDGSTTWVNGWPRPEEVRS